MKPDKITLIQFDRNIKSVDSISNIRDLMNVKFIGRGGTRIEPVMNWADKHKPKLLLVFTDGEFNFYNTDYKTSGIVPVVVQFFLYKAWNGNHAEIAGGNANIHKW